MHLKSWLRKKMKFFSIIKRTILILCWSLFKFVSFITDKWSLNILHFINYFFIVSMKEHIKKFIYFFHYCYQDVNKFLRSTTFKGQLFHSSSIQGGKFLIDVNVLQLRIYKVSQSDDIYFIANHSRKHV